MNKKFFIYLATTILFTSHLYGDLVKKNKHGYSFFYASFQMIDFSTDYTSSNGTTYHTSSSTTNPIYATGSLSTFSDSIDLSYKISTTLAPISTNEKLYTNNQLTQTEDTQMFTNDIQALLHYKITQNHRLLIGGNYNLSFWKRYNFIQNNTQRYQGYIIEQRDMSITLEAGYRYENYFSQNKLHCSFEVLGGMPIWSQTENTGENIKFGYRNGYRFETFVYAGYEILPQKELGLMIGYSYIFRDSASSNGVVAPEETMKSTYITLAYLF